MEGFSKASHMHMHNYVIRLVRLRIYVPYFLLKSYHNAFTITIPKFHSLFLKLFPIFITECTAVL